MASDEKTASEQQARHYLPLRIWPLLLLMGAIGICHYLPAMVEDPPIWIWLIAGFGPLICAALIALWWLAASRATARERVVGFLGLVLSAGFALIFLHPTMQGPGMMMLTIPLGIMVFGAAALLCSRMRSFRRTIVILLVTVCGFGYSTLLRNEGMWGDFQMGLHWRWEASAEDELLAELNEGKPEAALQLAAADVEQTLATAEWPAFRGADRTGVQRGSKIDSDWSTHPPEQVWKIAVGPGWSSFAVAGNLLFTQEQLGPQETVVCYSADDGEQLWIHKDESRFSDPLGGPGPRATPTIADGKVFATGANGHLTCVDPTNGDVIWQQDLREVAGRQPPVWGFSSSPLVANGLVIVHAGGAGDKGVLAFDAESGDLRWGSPAGDHSYSSPHPAIIAGKPAVLIATNTGLHVLDPPTGKQLLDYSWQIDNYRALQPRVLAGDQVLFPSGTGVGSRKIHITKTDGELAAEDLWTSGNLKGDYNDFVVYDGHAYGFDGSIFTSVDLRDGKRNWKRGRYGSGQVLLLEDCGLLLVISEVGEIVLLEANPDKHIELAKIPALKGKTWNHPVLVGDRLYIRNSQEAACFRLPLLETKEEEETPLAVSE